MEAKGVVWKQRHSAVRADLEMPQKYCPWAEKGRPYGGVPKSSARMRDAVEIAWGSRRPKSRFLPFFADLSQCVSRHCWGPQISTLATSARIFDFSKKRLLRLKEVLALQGYAPGNVAIPTSTSEATVLQAVGQGMFLPSLGKIMVALFLMEEGPWWR